MYLKPLEYNQLSFGDLVENITTKANPNKTDHTVYVGLEHLDPDCLHLHRWDNPSSVIGTKIEFQSGDVIFGRRRAYQRKVCLAEFNGICSAHASVFRANKALMLPEFLPFFIASNTFMNRAKSISVGSLSPTINWTTLKTETFYVPAIESQKRVTPVLMAADQLVEKWRLALSAVAELYISSLSELRERLLISSEYKIGDVLKLEYGKALPENKRSGTGFPVVGSNGIIGYHDEFLIDDPCIVVGRKGGAGEVTWYDDPIWPIDTSFFVRFVKSMNPRFTYYMLKSLRLKQLSITTAIPGLNRNDVHALKISLPDSREQQRWTDRLDCVSKLELYVQNQVEVSIRLLQFLIESFVREVQ